MRCRISWRCIQKMNRISKTISLMKYLNKLMKMKKIIALSFALLAGDQLQGMSPLEDVALRKYSLQ